MKTLFIPKIYQMLFISLSLSLSLFIFPMQILADELILPRETLLERGYQPLPHINFSSAIFTDDLPLNLPWPAPFPDQAHTVAQNYVNFQHYFGDAYIHGGCDVRSNGNASVIATVSGYLEGGFYGYNTNPDGSMEKLWHPWDGRPQRDPYFELAIVTEQGYRFEYHHVDSEKLPANIIEALNRGHVWINAGTLIGKVNAWAFARENYHHIHYNIIRPDGVRLNPEFYSQAIADHTPPKILGVYGISKQGRVVEIKEGNSITELLTELIVATTESHDNDAYVQTPPFAALEFQSHLSSLWDFRQFLTGRDGKFPPMWDLFRSELKLDNGRRLSTRGQYGEGFFLIRLPLAPADRGPFTLTVGDTAGNKSQFHAIIQLSQFN